MIQIEHDTGDLKREAGDLVKAIHDVPKRTAAGPSITRLREIAKLLPAAILQATNGDLYHFSVGLIAEGPSHGTSSVAYSCFRNSSGVILRIPRAQRGQLQAQEAVRRLILSVPGPELV